MLQFCVITKVPMVTDDGMTTEGNLAVTMDLFEEVPEMTAHPVDSVSGIWKRINPLLMLSVRLPVFYIGEVLIVDETLREQTYPGRKPSKWDIRWECFPIDQAEKAIARAREVSE